MIEQVINRGGKMFRLQTPSRAKRHLLIFAWTLTHQVTHAAPVACPVVDQLTDRVITLKSTGDVAKAVLIRTSPDSCVLRVVATTSSSLNLDQPVGATPSLFTADLGRSLRRQIAFGSGYADFSTVPFKPEIPEGRVRLKAAYVSEGADFLIKVSGEFSMNKSISRVDDTLRLTAVSKGRVFFAKPTRAPVRTTLGQQDPRFHHLDASIFAVSRADDEGASLALDQIRQRATAFVLDGRGLFATNHHVAEELGCVSAPTCRVRFSQSAGESPTSEWVGMAQMVGADPERDFALLAVTTNQSLPSLDIADESADFGPEIVSVGYPVDWCRDRRAKCRSQVIFSRGVITALGDHSLVTSAYSFGGASGGPVFDARSGQLIGYNSEIYGLGTSAAPANFLPLFAVRDVIARAKAAFGR